MKKIRIHRHPKMESDLNVPPEHVIIDLELYTGLLKKHGSYIEIKKYKMYGLENDESD